MASEEYIAAQKLAVKAYRSAVNKGQYPYLQALDDFLPYEKTSGEHYVGIIEIPLNLVVGTKTAGRQNSFANNFMPLLGENTEFALKWANLYQAQMEEGIHDPIVAYEYMHRFYVMEGNKRVSVLKSLDAAKISAKVTRILPKKTDDLENKIYYEFIDFYEDAELYDIWFTKEGSYARLEKLYGFHKGEKWTDEARMNLRSEFQAFRKAYKAKGGDKLRISTGDAFLAYADMFPTWELQTLSSERIRDNIAKIKDELKTISRDDSMKIVLEPGEEKASPAGTSLLKMFGKPGAESSKSVKIAFIYEKAVGDSAWNYAHDMGRMYLEQTFGDRVKTTVYEHAEYSQNPEQVLECAIEDGNEIIFTIAAQLANASARAAIKHPKIKILNCSTNSMYQSIRSYYCRMYETKFLLGIIAGALSKSNHIGYMADYPIYSTIANINAFALGAQMVNARAKVHLHWNCYAADNETLNQWPEDVDLVSDIDWIKPDSPTRKYGLYQKKNDSIVNIAASICHWGRFYERILRSIFGNQWKADSKTHALNYWWGISAGVLELVTSHKLPEGTKRLVDVLTEDIRKGTFGPFDGIWTTQEGTVINKGGESRLNPEQIFKMNYLASNIEGSIPKLEELKEEAREFVKLQGGLE